MRWHVGLPMWNKAMTELQRAFTDEWKTAVKPSQTMGQLHFGGHSAKSIPSCFEWSVILYDGYLLEEFHILLEWMPKAAALAVQRTLYVVFWLKFFALLILGLHLPTFIFSPFRWDMVWWRCSGRWPAPAAAVGWLSHSLTHTDATGHPRRPTTAPST